MLPSELRESFLGLWKQSHWSDYQVDPFWFLLWGYFYIWTKKMCPWSFTNCLWELLQASKDACREGLHKLCSRETLCGQKATENSFGWCRGCIRANVGFIVVTGKHQGCKDVQLHVWQATHHTLLLPKGGKFYGLAKDHWIWNMKRTALELFFCLLKSVHRLSLEISIFASSP